MMATKLLTALTASLCLAGCGDNNQLAATTNSSTKPTPSTAAAAEAPSATIRVQTEDGVTLYGQPYFAGLGDDAPMVLLFHQAGSNGRGEYGGIAAWLNENGYRAIAWDQRSGGDLFGETNRTSAALDPDVSVGYCDAYPDLEAALAYLSAAGLAEKAIVWGSSYSAALVFRLAKDHPGAVSGVAAFSPGTGGPMAECRARMWVNNVTAPIFVLRPASEMKRPASIEQRETLTTTGAEFLVVEHGVHGSSMLADERTENDMSAARAAVLDWLARTTGR